MENKSNAKRAYGNTIALIIVSLLASLLFWIYVTSTSEDDYTRSFNVSVVYDGETTMREARSLVLTERGVTSVRVTISGDRRTVSRLEDADLKAVIDLSGVSSTGRFTNSAYKITFPSGVDSSTLTVTSKIPESITYQVDRLASRYVQVRGVFNGSVAEGYSMEPMEFDPGTIRISGPQNAIEKVACAFVEISREDVDKTVTFDADFVLLDSDDNIIDDDSITTELDAVSVTLPVIAVKEVALTVKLLDGAGATSDNAKVTISPSGTITLAGDANVLDGVNSLVLATIDLSEVTDSFSDTYTVVLPDDTEIVSGSKEATVDVQLVGLETQAVSVTNFSCSNVTEGYDAQVVSGALTVTLRGTPEALANVSENNVWAVADLSTVDAFTGFKTVPVRIRIDGAPDVGALGSYTAIVNVTLHVDEPEEEVNP